MDAETLFNAAGPPRHSAANTVFRTYKHFAVVDVETPGQHRNDRIVEVAVVVVDRKGRIRDEWETLINPGGWPIGADASRTHGLYTTHLGRAPSFRDVGEALVRWPEGNVVVCDSRFHRSFLERELAAAGADADLGEGIDIGPPVRAGRPLAGEQRPGDGRRQSHRRSRPLTHSRRANAPTAGRGEDQTFVSPQPHNPHKIRAATKTGRAEAEPQVTGWRRSSADS